MTAFEDFWLNLRFNGQSINQKYPGEAIEDRRARAARAFELWREGRYTIDYDANEMKKAPQAAAPK